MLVAVVESESNSELETLNALIVAWRESADDTARRTALDGLNERLGRHTALDGTTHTRVLAGLIDGLRQEKQVTLCQRALEILVRVKATSAQGVLTAIARADGAELGLFAPPCADGFATQEDVIKLRLAAIRGLGLLEAEAAVEPLLRLLNDRREHYRLRLMAAESLGRIGNPRATNSLLDILADDREKSLYLKESSAKALGLLGDWRALQPLIDTLESSRPLREKMECLKEQLIMAIGKLGASQDSPYPQAVRSLIHFLEDEAPSLRLASVEALAELGDASCLPLVEARLNDKDDEVARAACDALYALGGETAIRLVLGERGDKLPLFVRTELESYLD